MWEKVRVILSDFMAVFGGGFLVSTTHLGVEEFWFPPCETHSSRRSKNRRRSGTDFA
jgi:hypothetical protein